MVRLGSSKPDYFEDALPENTGSENTTLDDRVSGAVFRPAGGSDRASASSAEALARHTRVLREDFFSTLTPGRAYFLPLADRDVLSNAVHRSVFSDVRIALWEITESKNFGALKSECLRVYAEVALSIWPNWYQRSPSGVTSASASWENHHSKAWFDAAAKKCQCGELPVVKQTSLEVNAQQLSLALSTVKMIHLWNVTVSPCTHQFVGALSLLAEWWSRNTLSVVCVVADPHWTDTLVVDHISYHRLNPDKLWDHHAVVDPVMNTGTAENTGNADLKGIVATALSDASPDSAVEPFHKRDADESKGLLPGASITHFMGLPHPHSPGEQLLYKALQGDPLLRDLFKPNVRALTKWERGYVVDFLWAEQRAVIEIDGYSTHSTRLQFGLDRQRDFELTVSGYCVIRFSHDAVMGELYDVMSKIRLFVAYLRARN